MMDDKTRELLDRAELYREKQLLGSTFGYALVSEMVSEIQSLSARVAELEGVLRQIQVGADRGLTQFSERQSGRRSPIWRSVNVLQDNLAACYGTALAALIKIDSDPALTKEAVVDGR